MERKEKGETAYAKDRIYSSGISALEPIGLRLESFSGCTWSILFRTFADYIGCVLCLDRLLMLRL